MTTPKTIEVPEELVRKCIRALIQYNGIIPSADARDVITRLQALLTKPQTTCGE